MKKQRENDKITITKTGRGGIIETRRQYSEIFRNGNIIVAYDKKLQEVIIYDNEFMVKKIPNINEVKKFENQTERLVVVVTLGCSAQIIVLQEQKWDIAELKTEYQDYVRRVCNIVTVAGEKERHQIIIQISATKQNEHCMYAFFEFTLQEKGMSLQYLGYKEHYDSKEIWNN